ncbi:FixH family protein [Undibacterium sp.]|uniref:FixH family protein n=1 Tax=Undibacterium sp. TaxID=1914977 RepID=UPI002C32A20C|nr:FixH family protein [Undibacterium sp.]HTD03634.1 FixH family protein [Undibacterium sp.]
MSSPVLAAGRQNPAPWFKQLWPWLLVTPPIVAVVAGSYMASLAYSAQDPMVVDDYYKEGQAINHDLRRDKVAATLKLSASMRYDAVKGTVAGKLRSAGSMPKGMLTVRLVHPTQPSKDLTISTQLDDDGNFTLPLPMLDRAAWQITLEDRAYQWRLTGVWHWPQQQGTDLNPL